MARINIDGIGKNSAKMVLDGAKACRCGVDLWELRTNIELLEALVKLERQEWLGSMPKLIDSHLRELESDCGVNVQKPKEILKEVESAITERDWPEAKLLVAFLGGSIIGPVHECSLESGDNPGDNPGDKEPWQMTREEYVASARQWRAEYTPRLTGTALERELEGVSACHKGIVRQVLAEGKPVPPEVLADYPELALPKTPWMEAGERLRSAGKTTRDDVKVGVWEERDRLHIYIEDKNTGATIAEWWDDDARQMFEDGFFKPGIEHRQLDQVPSREMADSVLSYAEDMGLLTKD